VLLVHLTDPHVVASGSKIRGVIDSNQLLLSAVRTINDLDPLPECVVITGDITHNGKQEEAEVARDILSKLEVPYWIQAGGHDTPSVIGAVFSSHLPAEVNKSKLSYMVELSEATLVMLNSSEESSSRPVLTTASLEWLASQLDQISPDRDIIIGLHHPPFPCKIPISIYLSEDPYASWAQPFWDVIAKHPNVKQVLSGHVHRDIHYVKNGVVCNVARSPNVQTKPFLGSGTPEDKSPIRIEPGAISLHYRERGYWWRFDAHVESE